MYHDYFGISESPFSITPDPRYLYMSKGHHEALAHLLYGVNENGGCVLLTGEVGTGKTSVCRCLLEQLPSTAEVALILNPRVNELELVADICDELDIVYPKGTTSLKVMVDLLNNHLLEIHAKGRHAVVIIDEAQNLSPEVLEQVRLLTNLETATRKLLQIILIGQPELSEILKRTDMRQLAQRVSAHYHLKPLSKLETPGYIRYRLAVGGLSPETFTKRAAAAIHQRSGGIPRIINSVCDRCLLGAYAQERKSIDHRLVRSASKEVFGAAPKAKRARSTRWPVVTAAAALLLLLLTPVVLGFFGKPQDWRADVEEVLFAWLDADAMDIVVGTIETPVPAAPSQDTAKPLDSASETAASQTQASSSGTVAAVTKPAASEPAATVTEDDAATEPVSGRTQDLAMIAAGIAATKERARAEVEEAAETAPDTGTEVLVPAAAPPPETQEGSEVATQIARAPAVSEQSDWSDRSEGALESIPRDAAAPRSCDQRGAADDQSVSKLADLLRDPAARQDRRSGMARLFQCWDVEFSRIDPDAPCARSGNGGLECLTGATGWTALAQVNRPAMITLTDANGKRRYVVVSALDGERVTLLSGDRRIETDTAALRPYWSGEYLILWRPPPLYYRLLARGARGADVVWLKDRFAELNGEMAKAEKITTFDSQLQERVVAFQRSQNLTADGIVGARTLIRINTVTGDPAVPLLRDAQPTAAASE